MQEINKLKIFLLTCRNCSPCFSNKTGWIGNWGGGTVGKPPFVGGAIWCHCTAVGMTTGPWVAAGGETCRNNWTAADWLIGGGGPAYLTGLCMIGVPPACGSCWVTMETGIWVTTGMLCSFLIGCSDNWSGLLWFDELTVF